jgi:hypothetical protein
VALGFGYDITESDVIVRWLGLPVRTIPLADVAEVHRGPSWSERFLNEHWPVLPLDWQRHVCIHRRNGRLGLLRNVIVVPDDPEAFVDRLRARLVHRALRRP